MSYEELWVDYFFDRSEVNRNRLVEAYHPLCRRIAGKMSGKVRNVSTVNADDLASYGVFGLMRAVELFDPKNGAKFETYAGRKIIGAIQDGLRSLDHVPRSVRDKFREGKIDEPSTVELMEHPELAMSHEPSPSKAMRNRETKNEMFRYLNSLQREIITGICVYKKTLQELSDELKLPIAKIRFEQLKAESTLRKQSKIINDNV